jgi:subtilisin-like proprotein convertase family protein
MFPTKQSLVRIIVLAAALGTTPSILAADPPDISPKEQMHLDMIALARQMADLRPQIPSDEAAAALHAQLRTAYQRMSDELGGDDPGRTILSGAPDATAAGGAMRMPSLPPDEGGIAGVLATPPGCGVQSNVFGNAADVPINDNSTAISTVIVTGMTGRVWYIEPQFDIAHTFCADLDITLTSPNGTTVTISTDNGGSFNDVFFGTEWRDSANPFHPVPYFNNPGLVTDHNYSTNGVVTPLVPEEPLHAFAGEDPNGVWTVRITDDEGEDVGTLFGWDMFVYTTGDPTSRMTRTFTNSAAGPLTDNGLTVRNIDVTGMGGYLCDVQVRLNVAHSFNDELDISLTSPAFRVTTLTTDNGGFFPNGFLGTTFDDSADRGSAGVHTATGATYSLAAQNVLTPEESFGGLRGTLVNGTWSLRIFDDEATGTGTFNSVSLILTTCSCNESCPADFNGDGFTDVDDLVGVILGWGVCP